MTRFLIFISLFFVISVDSARILGIFPAPSISHQVVFRELTLELARRGHELVVVTPNPALPTNRPLDNITEIDVHFAYDRVREALLENLYMYQRGVILDAESHLNEKFYVKVLKIIVDMFESPQFQKITRDKNQQFDLILVENFFNYHLMASAIFKAPVILFSSLHGLPEAFESIGTVGRHPILYPTVHDDSFDSETIFDRFKNVKFEMQSYFFWKKLYDLENEYLKLNYGPNAPTVEELKNNIDMMFINSHPIFCNNKPLPPNAVYVGPLHLKPLKEIPEDIKTFLDNSKTGVIYVSLGTNVRTALMDKDLLESFVEAFRELPYDILWKFDADDLENLPKNVRIQKWFPQRDLLVHPNIKLFVTQGGLQSTDEAIDAGVPLVGIPMLGDQYYNVNKYVELGVGEKVDAKTLNKKTLLFGINKVLGSDSYKKNILKLKKIMNDQPQSPLERAVWWTEYVIRHGGAKHLRAASAGVSLTDILMVDVLLISFGVVLTVLGMAFFALKYLVRKVVGSTKVKQS